LHALLYAALFSEGLKMICPLLYFVIKTIQQYLTSAGNSFEYLKPVGFFSAAICVEQRLMIIPSSLNKGDFFSFFWFC
jgi:hypothetical protein